MALPLLTVIDTIRELGWPGFVELLRNGIVLGSLYGLIALGYTMVYGILKLLNFAHGDVYMIGAFIGYGILTAFGGPLSPNIALLPLIVLMFAAGAILTMLANTMMPEAFEHGGKWVGIMVTVGFATAFTIHLLD